MKNNFITYFLLAMLMACNGVDSSYNKPTQSTESDAAVEYKEAAETQVADETLPPVETREANSDYQPAFKGQTRVAGVKTTTPYKVVLITEDLRSPWGAAALSDGRLLVTEKAGTMRIVDIDTGQVSEAISGLPEVDDRGQGGLLGLALAPDFESSRMVYWVFSERVKGGNHTAVAKGRLADNEARIEGAEVIYRATPTYDGKLHYGGRIVFDQDGDLFVSIGERSDRETRVKAQDLSVSIGSIIHITTEGEPVSDNPFIDLDDALAEIYSYGHRNPQGLAFHPVTGELWSGEFGPRGGDELNLIKPGNNYGWPVITYGIEYMGAAIGDPVIQQKEGMEQPVYYWDPVLSPSGMTFYSGTNIPEWENNLFMGGLNSSHIARLVIEDNRVVGEERLLTDKGERFRDVIQGNDGALYTITDAGNLYKIDKQ
ncbi:glucose dehydrogenase [Marinicella pacifica]|uniref:Glucose dehydrogenase n=1 Tax=Marinicella pacifica TaxID=1171543 RepID=A0A917FRS7_9GAMM|nr:PQQ-dependent sugar dehydrogenase [Marinicella pacifica]GGG02217.1 glucose dehydrogenase [Marinicella pacifica]